MDRKGPAKLFRIDTRNKDESKVSPFWWLVEILKFIQYFLYNFYYENTRDRNKRNQQKVSTRAHGRKFAVDCLMSWERIRIFSNLRKNCRKHLIVDDVSDILGHLVNLFTKFSTSSDGWRWRKCDGWFMTSEFIICLFENWKLDEM